MDFLVDLIPGWVFAVLLVAVWGTLIVLKLIETHEEPSFDSSQAIFIGTLRIWVDIDKSPDDPKTVLIGKKIRTRLEELLQNRLWFYGRPRARFVRASSGSILFDYEIYVLVGGYMVAKLKDYEDVRDGLRSILSDIEKVREALYRVSFRIGAKFSRSEFKLESEAEFAERARKWTERRAESVRERVKVREGRL